MEDTVIRVFGIMTLVLIYHLLKRFFAWLLSFNYKHDKKSLEQSREFLKFKKA